VRRLRLREKTRRRAGVVLPEGVSKVSRERLSEGQNSGEPSQNRFGGPSGARKAKSLGEGRPTGAAIIGSCRLRKARVRSGAAHVDILATYMQNNRDIFDSPEREKQRRSGKIYAGGFGTVYVKNRGNYYAFLCFQTSVNEWIVSNIYG
jgi:hypothetical protein